MNRFDKPNINRFDKPYRVAPFLNNKKYIEMFDLASKLDTHELLQFSLINQIPFDIADDDGNTLIHIVCDVDSRKASQYSKLGVIKFLVNNGANPDKANKYNQTPLHLACQQQADVIVEYLLSIDVDPNYKDNMGLTPFHYALTGNIKPINSTGKIMDFIPPPKRVDNEKKDIILEIKRELNNLLNSPKIVDNFPIFTTFENTIKNILEYDNYFINQRSLILNKITNLAENNKNPNYLSELNNTISIYLFAIKKKIDKYFNGFPQLNNFNIHLTLPTSWSHPTNIKQYSIIENGNIRQMIKNDINDAKDIAIKLIDSFKPYDGDLNILSDSSYNFIMNCYIYQIVQDIRPYQGNYHYYNGQINYDTFANLENDLRHHNAFDNSSSIIDLESLKYTGGPRNIIVDNLMDPNHPDKHISHLDDIKRFSGMNNKKLILTLLWPVYTYKNYNYNTEIDHIVTDIDNKTLNLLDFDINDYTTYFSTTINTIKKITQIAQGLGPQPLNIIQFATLCFIIFSYIAIMQPHRFNDLINHSYLCVNGKFDDNIMVNKWYDNFRTGNYNVGVFIFSMWSDITCMYSGSNLDGTIQTKLLMLISGLTINKTDVEQSFFNAYKPQIVADICNCSLSEPKKIAQIVMLFLNDNCTHNYFNNICSDPSTIYTNPNTYNVDTNVALIGKIFEIYFNNPNSFQLDVSTDEGKLYKSFYRLDKTVFDNLINIFINQYEKMDNKPHKASITDLIYLLTKYNNNKQFNIFTYMTTNTIINWITANPNKNLNLQNNFMPSIYGIQNIFIDENNVSNVPQKYILNHFTIAHMLGLYFEGICYPLQKNIDLTYKIKYSNGRQEFDVILAYYNTVPVGPPVNSDKHYFAQNSDKLEQSNLPLPFNNVIIKTNDQFPYIAKHTYYNINNRDLIIPSIYSYYLHIINKIKYYQEKLNISINEANDHIENMSKGKTGKIERLFTDLYPQIVAYCRIINLFTESYRKFMTKYSSEEIWTNSGIEFNFTPSTYNYIELAQKINIINANYFIYYYIFSPNKIVKLSKFNYFQIPVNTNTSTPDKYLYYSVSNSANSGNPFTEKSLSNPNPQETLINTTNISKGFINDFPLGNYNSLYDDYKNNFYMTDYTIEKNDFVANKYRDAPPSLMANLENFYKYCLIELIEKTIVEIDNNKSGSQEQLYTKIINIITKSSVNFDREHYELSAYVFVSKLVQEIIREQFEIYVNNAVNKTFREKIMQNKDLSLPTSNIFNPQEITISFDKTDIDFSKITDTNDLKNVYNILVQPTNQDIFILYSNDLTNISKLRIKNGIYINNNIIQLLLAKRSSPYHINLEGQTPIYSLIKNYNYEPIQHLKKLGIDFRYFENDSPIKFMIREYNNNLDKIIENINNASNIDVLSKFDNYLYNDVKTLIMSNDAYGNNILSYLPQSFHMSTYIVLQYLIENLINTDDNYTLDDLMDFLSLIDVDIADINKNYLFENFAQYNVLDDFDAHIANEYYQEKHKELLKISDEINIMTSTIHQLSLTNTTKSLELANKIQSSSKYIDINEKKLKINNELINLNIITRFGSYFPNILVSPNFKVIPRYQKPDIDMGLIMHGWKELLNVQYSTENYNLGLINMLIKQKELINNLNLSNRGLLTKMLKPLKKIEEISTSYFLNKKNIDTNKVSHFVRDMLEYLTEITICTSLELVIRRILYTYFLNAQSNDTYDDISTRISFILESTHTGLSKSLKDILQKDIKIELVKSASEIFDNKFDEQGYTVRPPRDIFIDFFQLFENAPIKLPNEIMNIFLKDVVSYFDTFTTKTILLWQVNAENIFKYFINNYRCTQTLLSM